MIISALSDLAHRVPDRVFATLNGEDLTIGQLHQAASAFAVHLTDEGLRSGDRAAVMMHNSLEAICVVFGLAMAGVAWVPVNPRLVGPGLSYQLSHSEPQLVICDEEFQEVVQAPKIITHGAETRLSAILGTGRTFDARERSDDDLFAIMYTSGTTGPPKGVMISHRMMAFAGEGVRLATGARAGDVMFMWEPLYHIGGAQMLILPLLVPARLALVPRFSASRFWDEVNDAGATHIHYLGGILQMLLKQPPRTDDRAHGVRVAWGGGCAAETWEQFQQRFAIPIHECYGMSEASSLTSADVDGVIGSVGRPMEWLEVMIADPDENGRGEILVGERRPGALFSGYFRNAEATAKALRAGTLHTGDLGSLDKAGNLYFHGRMNDSIRVKGELVSAWEIESVAASHGDVEECAAVGVDADVGEQEIVLFVRLQRGSNLMVEALADWLAPRLAPHQRPARFRMVDDFPRTPSQRIIKGQLRA
ncbi:MAG: AMP-binding protein [Pseudomonadota bacterium]